MANVIAIMVIVAMIFIAYYLYRAMFTRGLRKVVAIFRAQQALDPKSAKTLAELGLETPPYIRRMFRPRDYKRSAAELLHREGVVKVVEGGRFYLSESALSGSRISRFIDQDRS